MNTANFWVEKLKRQINEATSCAQLTTIVMDAERAFTSGHMDLPDDFWLEMTQMLGKKNDELS